MSADVVTVGRAAARLGLHAKTVLRFIREGRLHATKVGRSYRILRSDLDALVGKTAPPTPVARVRVTSIVDIPDIDPEAARRMAAMLPAARGGGEGREPMSLDFAHDPDRRSLKVVIVGAPDDTAGMLKLLQVWLEAAR